LAILGPEWTEIEIESNVSNKSDKSDLS